MNKDDIKKIQTLRKITGCPLPLVRDIYFKYIDNEEKAIDELKKERKILAEKIKSRPLEKTIVFAKKFHDSVKVLKIQTQTDFFPRTIEAQQLFMDILNGKSQNEIDDEFERLITSANENIKIDTIEVSDRSNKIFMSVKKGMWSDINIKDQIVGESITIITYKNPQENENTLNMITSKISSGKPTDKDQIAQLLPNQKLKDIYNSIDLQEYYIIE